MSSFLILRCPEIPAIFRSQIISAVYPKDSFFVLFFSLSRTPIYLGNLFITTCRMLFYCCLLCEKYDQNSLLLPVSPRSSRRSHTEPMWGSHQIHGLTIPHLDFFTESARMHL